MYFIVFSICICCYLFKNLIYVYKNIFFIVRKIIYICLYFNEKFDKFVVFLFYKVLKLVYVILI